MGKGVKEDDRGGGGNWCMRDGGRRGVVGEGEEVEGGMGKRSEGG